MKKIFLSLIVIINLFISVGYAAPNLDETRWMMVDDTPEVAVWIDTQTLRFVKDNYSKRTMATICMHMKSNDITVLDRFEYDLNAEQHRFLREEVYNTYNQLISSKNTVSPWMTPVYGTINYEIDVVLHAMFLAREETGQ